MDNKKIHQSRWLAPAVLQWQVIAQGGDMHDTEPWQRPYAIWAHAEQLLEKPGTDFVRVDAITTLKRAIEQRVKLLMDIYKLQNIPIKNKPARTFELLEYIGIIKPFMLKKLIDIRNAVEHEDAAPPSCDDCRVFLEFVWYFLRSTDSLVRLSVDMFNLYPDGQKDPIGPYGLESEMGPRNGWTPEVRGTVRPNLISENPMDGWIELNIRNIETHSTYLSRQFSLGLPTDHLEEANPEDIHFSGEIKGPTERLRSFIQIYFKAL